MSLGEVTYARSRGFGAPPSDLCPLYTEFFTVAFFSIISPSSHHEFGPPKLLSRPFIGLGMYNSVPKVLGPALLSWTLPIF